MTEPPRRPSSLLFGCPLKRTHMCAHIQALTPSAHVLLAGHCLSASPILVYSVLRTTCVVSTGYPCFKRAARGAGVSGVPKVMHSPGCRTRFRADGLLFLCSPCPQTSLLCSYSWGLPPSSLVLPVPRPGPRPGGSSSPSVLAESPHGQLLGSLTAPVASCTCRLHGPHGE